MQKQTLKNTIFIGLFLIPFIPFLVSSSLFFPFITTKAFAFRIIVEIVFAAWLVLALLDKEYRPKKSPILYALTSFLVIIGIANLFGEAPVKSFWSNYERMEGYVALLHLGALFLVMGSIFKNVDWKRWWNTSLTASFVMVVYCLFQLAGVLTINQGGVRVDGTLGNASYLAVYMLFHVFIALFFFYRSSRESMLKWVYGPLILLQAFILYHTATRGAILGFIGGILIISLLNLRNRTDEKVRKISIAGLIGLIILVSGFFVLRDSSLVRNSPVLARFASISTEELKGGGRSFVWPMALKGVAENPILGWGQDNFNYIFNKYYDSDMFRLEPWFDRAHNIFLDWAVAGGLLGLVSYLSLYGALLYMVWRKDRSLSLAEKSILTGLIAAYFFHNIFVFDNLISYILFFALLAHIHSENEGDYVWRGSISENRNNQVILPIISVATIFVVYSVNISPLLTNLNLLRALASSQGLYGGYAESVEKFERAYEGARLGRPEIVEQVIFRSPDILSSDLSVEEKSEFYNFAKRAALEQAEKYSTDARYQLITGTFLSSTNSLDEALGYLEKAQELSPGKQTIRFEIGAALVNQKKYAEALKVFKDAYELAPENRDAGIIYLIGAIYARDYSLENQLVSSLTREIAFSDQRVFAAYYANGRQTEARQVLETMTKTRPELKAQIDEYLKQF